MHSTTQNSYQNDCLYVYLKHRLLSEIIPLSLWILKVSHMLFEIPNICSIRYSRYIIYAL